jgi:hypothetical protein
MQIEYRQLSKTPNYPNGAGEWRNCKICGMLFYATPIQLKRGTGILCSYKCSGIAKKNIQKKGEDLMCEECGKMFYLPPSHRRSRKLLCSKKCSNEFLHKRKEQRLLNNKTTCKYCTKEFYPTHPNAVYCSIRCRSMDKSGANSPRWKGGEKVAKCLGCGKEYKHHVSCKGLVCSMKCWGAVQAQYNREHAYSRTRGGKREDLDGAYFRSGWEANYARYLNWQIKNGLIQGWEYEPETFEFVGIKRGSRFYTPDFKVLLNSGEVEYHEIKGWMDNRSKTKLRRMTKYHPTIKIVLIGEKQYYAIAKQISACIPNWERKSNRKY